MSIIPIEKPSVAREFFLKITRSPDPVSELTNLVNGQSPAFESEWLDFKGAERIQDKEIKQIWSQALAGFGNTQGGVLIWGIDARKDKTAGIDAASGLSLVPSPAGLKSRLNELHAQSTEPPVLGVEIEFYTARSSGEGFVICYIPESPFRPHRAEQADRQYVIRAGDDFVTASVSLLRNLFFPQTRCHLLPTLRAERQQKGDHWRAVVTGQIENRGAATAFDAYVIVHSEPDGLNFKIEGWESGPVLTPWHGRALHPIHPGISQQFYRLYVSNPTNLKFRVQIFARDAEPYEWVFSFSQAEVEQGARKSGTQRSLFF